jgi:hypothetical protein
MKTQEKKITGSGIGKFRKGEEIVSVSQLRVGDLLADFSPQFNAMNLMKVVEIAEDGSRFYGIFVDPVDTAKVRLPGDDRICVWNFEIGRSSVMNRIEITPFS